MPGGGDWCPTDCGVSACAFLEKGATQTSPQPYRLHKPITGWRWTTVPKHSGPRRTTPRADMVATGSFHQVIPPWLPKSRGGIPGRCSDLNSHAGESRWARIRQNNTARFRREINDMTQTPNKKRAHGATTPWTQTETIDNLKEGLLFCSSTTVASSVSRVNKRFIKEERPNKMVPNPWPPVSLALFAQAVFIAAVALAVALAVVLAFLRKPESEKTTIAPAINGSVNAPVIINISADHNTAIDADTRVAA